VVVAEDEDDVGALGGGGVEVLCGERFSSDKKNSCENSGSNYH